jgi:hypothetical protein
MTVAGCSDSASAEYESYEAARAAGAIAQGWVPEWLPPTATFIREVHNLNTNQSMLSFRFESSGPPPVLDECHQIDPFAPGKPPFKTSWWPGDVPASRLSTYRHVFYSCEQGKAFLAISSELGEGFFWRSSWRR